MVTLQFDRAVADYSEIIRLYPSAPAFGNRGMAEVMAGNTDKGMADLDEAVRLDPHAGAPQMHRGMIRGGKGDKDGAIADFNEAVRAEPTNTTILNNSSVFLCQMGRYDEAIASCNAAIHLDPNDDTALRNRAHVWLGKKEYAKALADYSEAVRVNPQNAAWPLNERARLLATCPDEKLRDGAKAFADAQKACESYGWKNADCLDTLAAACAEMGQFTEAVMWQTRVVDMLTDAKKPVEDARKRLDLYTDHKPYHDAIQAWMCEPFMRLDIYYKNQ